MLSRSGSDPSSDRPSAILRDPNDLVSNSPLCAFGSSKVEVLLSGDNADVTVLEGPLEDELLVSSDCGHGATGIALNLPDIDDVWYV